MHWVDSLSARWCSGCVGFEDFGEVACEFCIRIDAPDCGEAKNEVFGIFIDCLHDDVGEGVCEGWKHDADAVVARDHGEEDIGAADSLDWIVRDVPRHENILCDASMDVMGIHLADTEKLLIDKFGEADHFSVGEWMILAHRYLGLGIDNEL